MGAVEAHGGSVELARLVALAEGRVCTARQRTVTSQSNVRAGVADVSHGCR